MKERGILFSAPMVRALLAGTKTQTRRIVAGQLAPCVGVTHFPQRGLMNWTANDAAVLEQWREMLSCPYGAPGDRLWVRETWYDDLSPAPEPNARLRYDDGRVGGIEYRASHDCTNFEAGCPCNPDGDGKRSEWRPSIYMPRWASRITLEITDVRVERLQSISEEDARAEGLALAGLIQPGHAAGCFARLWDEINGKRAPWSSNPWLWSLTFKRVTT